MNRQWTVALSLLALHCAACAAPRKPLAPAADSSESRAPEPATAPVAEQPAATAAAAFARDFDQDGSDRPPPGFSFARTGTGPLGRWVVRSEPGAPSGANVLAQLDTDDTDDRFPVAVLSEPALRDVRVSVRCKMISGRVDEACGLVARYRDENNYLVTRANALGDNVRLYFVGAGQRHQLASWSGRVTPNQWHAYRFDVRGDHLEVYWDGQRVLDHHDATFSEAGRVGVWTKADSVTYFDDLRAEAP